MKRRQLTDILRTRLETAGADPSKVTVFEATALNTRPVRKRHPLYKDGVHSRAFLDEMRDALLAESLPVQTMHNDYMLPIGRAFFSELVDNSVGAELRVLFWIDDIHQDLIDQVNSGTIDQVSVQVLPKKVECSMCGFDFFGDDASYEHIWSATCPNEHTMGKDGAHVIFSHLDTWYELSLVGKGGIKGARIHSAPEARLAADGSPVSALLLNISSADLSETPNMDLKELVEQLTDAKAQVTTLTADIASLTTERDTARTDLSARDAEIVKLSGQIKELASNAEALTILSDIAKHVLTLTGRVTDAVPTTPADILKLVKETKLSIGSPQTRASELADDPTPTIRLDAFRSAR